MTKRPIANLFAELQRRHDAAEDIAAQESRAAQRRYWAGSGGRRLMVAPSMRMSLAHERSATIVGQPEVVG